MLLELALFICAVMPVQVEAEEAPATSDPTTPSAAVNPRRVSPVYGRLRQALSGTAGPTAVAHAEDGSVRQAQWSLVWLEGDNTSLEWTPTGMTIDMPVEFPLDEATPEAMHDSAALGRCSALLRAVSGFSAPDPRRLAEVVLRTRAKPDADESHRQFGFNGWRVVADPTAFGQADSGRSTAAHERLKLLVTWPNTLGAAVLDGQLAVDGGSLSYQVTGVGRTVVLIHGGFGDRRMWDDVFHPLGKSFRVVRYDHRGFGGSTSAEQPYAADADLLRLLDALGTERAHLVGNSVGGELALSFGLRHPERVDRLVVVAAGAAGYPYSERETAETTRAFAVAREEGVDQAVPIWLSSPMIRLAMQNPSVRSDVRRMIEENASLLTMDHWPEVELDRPAFELLPQLKAPTLYVIGKNDIDAVNRAATASDIRTPDSHLIQLHGADHLPQMEQPVTFVQLLELFLAD